MRILEKEMGNKNKKMNKRETIPRDRNSFPYKKIKPEIKAQVEEIIRDWAIRKAKEMADEEKVG